MLKSQLEKFDVGHLLPKILYTWSLIRLQVFDDVLNSLTDKGLEKISIREYLVDDIFWTRHPDNKEALADDLSLF